MTRSMGSTLDIQEPLFADDRRFWPFAAVVLGLLSFAKGVRVPGRYAATQALVDYSKGLVKRGFFGATVGRALHLERFANFVEVSYLLLLVMFGMLTLLTVRRGLLRQMGIGIPVAIYAASFAITYMVTDTGLLDIPVALLTIGLLLISDARLRFVAALPGCTIALMIHELFLVVFLPVLLLSFLVDAQRGARVSRRSSLAMVAALAILCLGITVKLALHAPLTAQAAESMRREMQARADFPVREEFFPVLMRSTRDNMTMMREMRHERSYWAEVSEGTMILLPVVGMLLYVVRRAGRQLAEGRMQRLLVAAATFAALAPFAMNLIGWDFERFGGLVCLTCFLVMAIVCPGPDERPVTLPAWYRNAAVLVIAISMVGGEQLPEGSLIRTYPFLTDLQFGVSSVLHQHWNPPRK